MARRINWKAEGDIQLREDVSKSWLGVLEVAEQGRTRIRLTKRHVARFKGIRGEDLEQLKLPTFWEVDNP